MIFGIPIWRIILIITLIFLVIKRADLVAAVGRVKYGKRQFPEAMKIFKIADKIGNLNISNKITLGYVCLRCGALEEARKNLRLCLSLTKRDSADRNQVKNLLALVSWKEGNLSDAIEELEEVIASGYKNTVIYQNLGILYNLSGDKEKALAFNKEGYEYNSDDHIICDNLADAYAINGEYEKAAEIYAALMEQDPPPRFPEAYYGYGKVLIALGRKEEGVAMIEKSLTKPFSYLSICPREEIEELCRSYGGQVPPLETEAEVTAKAKKEK
ncbi:tetratricopeptide repeat protein [Ructibacterium gallinarum]|uniref:Tetratricopeptide repeat protein n=1 Tax=Ructibacterium gallinarum TaxID=2779355 RepID=A0A9D5M3V9_9FIRM|nr:tetratricopeptide repeat protein [Ructibacterium gallinarum]MBE5040214.1 tetratricopeptide repeat protein [Ructibacterium gallinarum]